MSKGPENCNSCRHWHPTGKPETFVEHNVEVTVRARKGLCSKIRVQTEWWERCRSYEPEVKT